MQRQATVAVLLGVIFLSLAGPVLADRKREVDGELPQVLYTTLSKHDPGYPTFVSAEAAVAPDGTINSHLFRPDAIELLRDILDQKPAKGCIRTEEVWWDEIGVPERSTLETAARNSDLVFVGKVVGREYGFRFMEAGQLVEVAVEEVLRGSTTRDRYFTFVPVGTFRAGPYAICKIDRRYVAPPEVGDRVVLLAPKVEDFSEPYVDLVDGSGLIVLGDGSGVRLPEELAVPLQRDRIEQGTVLSILRNASRIEARKER